MSTPCTIAIQEEDGSYTTAVVLYDGHPEEVIPAIKDRVMRNGFEAFQEWVRGITYLSVDSDTPLVDPNRTRYSLSSQPYGYLVHPDHIEIVKGSYIFDGHPELDGELEYLYGLGNIQINNRVPFKLLAHTHDIRKVK